MYKFLKEKPDQATLHKDIYEVSKPYDGIPKETVALYLTLCAVVEPDFHKLKGLLASYVEGNKTVTDIMYEVFNITSSTSYNIIKGYFVTAQALQSFPILNAMTTRDVELAAAFYTLNMECGNLPLLVEKVLAFLHGDMYTLLALELNKEDSTYVDILKAKKFVFDTISDTEETIHSKKDLAQILQGTFVNYLTVNKVFDLTSDKTIPISKIIYKKENTDVPF